MVTIKVVVKDTFDNLVDGYVQLGEQASPTKNGMCEFAVTEGEYVARAIVPQYRGQAVKVNINQDDTITLFVKRG